MSFFDEIKRRNVIRVAAAYAVVGWLILKVADIVLDFAGAPDWVGKGVIALLIVGFIPAIILAWLFEVTPDGVKRDDGKSDVADNARSQRLDKITIGAVVVLAGMFLWQQYRARSFQNIPETIEIFEQAVALDSEFARAWAGLAAITGVASSWGHVDEDYKQQSRDAAQRAIELDDELALPYAVLGSLLTEEVPANSVKVFELFAKALERNPDEVNALLWRGVHRIAVGEFEGASNDLTHCLAVDAAYENCRQHLAAAEYYAGNQDAAFLLFEQSVANGGTARGLSFAAAYVTAGDLRSALHIVKWVINSFNFTVKLDQFYRAMTRPDFDFVKERREFEIEVEAETGASLDWHTLNDIEKISFRNCEAMTPNATMSIWWDPSFPHFLTSPHRKRLIRELGIYDYWLARGFPSQCRSAGDDDFECDQ